MGYRDGIMMDCLCDARRAAMAFLYKQVASCKFVWSPSACLYASGISKPLLSPFVQGIRGTSFLPIAHAAPSLPVPFPCLDGSKST